jgi:hypothetical protein
MTSRMPIYQARPKAKGASWRALATLVVSLARRAPATAACATDSFVFRLGGCHGHTECRLARYSY